MHNFQGNNFVFSSHFLLFTLLFGASVDYMHLYLWTNNSFFQSGIGGPLLNCYGEVIGVNFYNKRFTPFLPINIVSKCLKQFKKYEYVPNLCMNVIS